VYHSISPFDKPVVFTYNGIDRYTLAGLYKAWSGVQWNMSEYDSLKIGYGNNKEDVIDSMGSKRPEKNNVYILTHSPYRDVFVAVSTVERSSELKLSIKSKILPHLPVMAVLGILLYHTAKYLSRYV